MSKLWCPVHYLVAGTWLVLSITVAVFGLNEVLQNYGWTFSRMLMQLNTYGKTAKEEYPFLTNLNVAKSRFKDFYIVSVFFTLILLIILLSGNSLCDLLFEDILYSLVPQLNCSNDPLIKNKTTILISVFLSFCHGLRRYYESRVVNTFSKTSKINIIQYFVGCTFYILEPLTIMFMAIPAAHLQMWESLPMVQIFAICSYIIFSYIQFCSTRHLAAIRKESKKQYAIPYSFLFHYITCPHYLMEVLIYFTVLLFLEFELLYSYVLLFVIVIHLNMAYCSHKWAIKTFQNYPSHRRALIPFVF